MSEFLSLANARLLLWLNGALADQPLLYRVALFLTDEGADILTIGVLAYLWFWREPKREQLLSPSLVGAKGKPKRRLHGDEQFVSREQSRAQLLTTGFALMSGYVIARLIALNVDVDRPFMTYLPVRAPFEGTFEDLRTFGSFPSDHAVLLAGLPVALAYWNARWAWVAAGLGLFLALVRVAVGFHFPGDMLGGALVGIGCVWLAMSAYRREGRLHSTMNALARGFNMSNAPYCYFLYGFLALVGIEFAMHFKHVLQAIFTIQGDLSWRFGSKP